MNISGDVWQKLVERVFGPEPAPGKATNFHYGNQAKDFVEFCKELLAPSFEQLEEENTSLRAKIHTMKQEKGYMDELVEDYKRQLAATHKAMEETQEELKKLREALDENEELLEDCGEVCEGFREDYQNLRKDFDELQFRMDSLEK